MISWLHRPIIFDVRTRPRSVPSITGTKDIKAREKQSTSGDRAELLPNFFTNLGLDYEERVLPLITNEILKSVAAEQSRQANVIAEEGVARTADLIGKALDEAGDDKFSNVFHYLVLLLF
ncbi:unnamed protein product [Rotaria sordida]|uniref:Prohibitin n=1 Tax=Rotaria sordida TaxID=392033 RepID=A0A820C513_9BILA|nr:unnamed protein product [Rotaria sordida]